MIATSTTPRRYVVALALSDTKGAHVGDRTATVEAYDAPEAVYQALVEAMAELPGTQLQAISVAPETLTVWARMREVVGRIAIRRLPSAALRAQ